MHVHKQQFEKRWGFDGNEVGSTKDVKLMINEMVREIDKCIALLKK